MVGFGLSHLPSGSGDRGTAAEPPILEPFSSAISHPSILPACRGPWPIRTNPTRDRFSLTRDHHTKTHICLFPGTTGKSIPEHHSGYTHKNTSGVTSFTPPGRERADSAAHSQHTRAEAFPAPPLFPLPRRWSWEGIQRSGVLSVEGNLDGFLPRILFPFKGRSAPGPTRPGASRLLYECNDRWTDTICSASTHPLP
jgi:hypothetical protein